MAASGFDVSWTRAGPVSLADAVRVFRSLGSLVSALDVDAFEPEDLVELTAGVRDGQNALDRLLLVVGAAADRNECDGKGRGAHGTLLGDGRRVRGRTARREADRARTAASLRRVGAAVKNGSIGAAQLDAITQAARGLSEDEQQLLNTDELMKAAASQPADTFARHVRREVERIKGDHGLGETKQRQARSSWRHWFDDRTGMGHVHGEFDPERYESIVGSVERELTRMANAGDVSKDSNLAAAAAHALLTGESGGRSRSARPHINLVVDWETFTRGPHDVSVRETAVGHSLPPESIARLACDAVLQRVVLDTHGVPVNVGRRHRTATDAQWHAMRAIYRTCAWSACDRPLSWCQLHHVQEWENGGSTDLCNLIPLCNRHHHQVHEGGWSVQLQGGNRRLDIHLPDGTFHCTTGPDRMKPPPRAGPVPTSVPHPAPV